MLLQGREQQNRSQYARDRDYALYIGKRHASASTYRYEIRKGNEFLALADRFDAALAEIYTQMSTVTL